MVMKSEFGPAKMRRFLKYELDRYLIGRTTERKKELPLLRVEDQDYIHYRKGSLVMYALQDYIGEEAVNQTLARYIQAVAFRGPPYTTAADLLAYLREATPDKYQYVLEDMFETITLYDNRAKKASYRQRPDGKYEIRLTTSSKKLRADSLGKEQEVPLNDWIDIGLLDEKGNAFYLQKEKIEQREMEFLILADRRPAKAGIDPLNKLIDRKPDDNSIKVEKESAEEERETPRARPAAESSAVQ
jgi:aminopeptidase N